MKWLGAIVVTPLLLCSAGLAQAHDDDDTITAPGMVLTPLAMPGAKLATLGTLDGTRSSPVITNPSAMATSPDGTIVAVLTSGFNLMSLSDGTPDRQHSSERLMLFKVGPGGAAKIAEAPVPASFAGLAWSGDGTRIAVTLGYRDAVAVFGWDGHALTPDGAPVSLGHQAGLGLHVKPAAAGVAWADANRLLVTNFFNDSVSLVDLAKRTVVAEIDLRPGKIDPAQRGVPGGTYPFRIAMTTQGHAVVSAPRDRELITLGLDGDTLHVVARAHAMAEPTAPMGGCWPQVTMRIR